MKYSRVKTREICKYSRQGNNNKDAATLADIDEDTFYEWMKKSSL